jgi:hypothetical protein
MAYTVIHRIFLVTLLCGLVLTFMPVKASATSSAWLDEITALVSEHQEMAKYEGRERTYDPYLSQLSIVSVTLRSGNEKVAYEAMNHFMDMLENDPEGSGIPTWSAKTIFDFCGRVTPAKYHDAARHDPVLSKGGFDYWGDNTIDFGGGA